MKNIQKESEPLVNIERNPLLLLAFAVVCGALGYYTYTLFVAVSPMAFIAMVPAAILLFQLLWLIVNPFALVFEDKIEIKQSFFHHKFRYFVDIKKISQGKSGKIYITYNDDEMEALNLFGIRSSHQQLLKSEMEKSVLQSLQKRG